MSYCPSSRLWYFCQCLGADGRPPFAAPVSICRPSFSRPPSCPSLEGLGFRVYPVPPPNLRLSDFVFLTYLSGNAFQNSIGRQSHVSTCWGDTPQPLFQPSVNPNYMKGSGLNLKQVSPPTLTLSHCRVGGPLDTCWSTSWRVGGGRTHRSLNVFGELDSHLKSIRVFT